MTTGVPRVVSINAKPKQVTKESKQVGLSAFERQVLLDEIARIAAELDELQRRAAQIAGRIAGPGTGEASPERVDRSA